MQPAVKLVNVSKTFVGNVRAVDSISIELDPGKIIGIVGPNGAGKSTIMNIAAGYLFPDTGEVWVNGLPVVDFHQAINVCGVVKVDQHPNLAPHLSAAQHLAMLQRTFRPSKTLIPRAEQLLRQLGVDLDLDLRTEDMPIGHLRAFEIVKALLQCEILRSRGLRPVLILDEATNFLPVSQKSVLKQHLRKLVADGYTFIMVSHDLPEIIDVADEILVMVGGKVRTRHRTAGLDVSSLVKSMFDTEVSEKIVSVANVVKNAEAMVLEDFHVKDDRGNIVVNGLTLRVLSGEIHGVAVFPGTGEKELVESIFGLRRVEQGRLTIFGQNIRNPSVQLLRKMGVALLSDDRIRDGLLTDGSVYENLTLGLSDKYTRGGFIIDTKRRTQLAETLIREYGIVTRGLKEPITNLSGGNMQRVYIARVLGRDARILLALHPTMGLDPMGSSLLFQKISELRSKNLTVLMFSPNIKEMMTICDRVSVMRDGKIVGTFIPAQTSVESLGMILSGVQ
ncbi:MAG: ATP-binding cassette domain-containing protein [Candidatus Caldarchaeum sp.]